MLPIKLDDLIEVAVRLAPDLARAKVDRSIAKDTAAGARRDQAWVATSHARVRAQRGRRSVEVPPFSVVAEDQVSGGVGLAKNLPTGGQIQLEADARSTRTSEYNVYDRLSGPGSAAHGADARTRTASPYESCRRTRPSSPAHVQAAARARLRPGGRARRTRSKADLASTEATIKAQLAAEEMIARHRRGVLGARVHLATRSTSARRRVELAQKQDQLTHEQIRAGAVGVDRARLGRRTRSRRRQEALLRAQLELEQKSLDLRRKAGLELGRRDIVLRPAEAFEIGDEDFDVEEVLAAQPRRRTASSRPCSSRRRSRTSTSRSRRTQVKPQLDLQLRAR